MDRPSLTTHTADGRYFLRTAEERYDLIVMDAYRQPYIPFHLTTIRFFGESRQHLTERGVLTVNVGHGSGDRRVVESVARTMNGVFEHVYAFDTGEHNTIFAATRQGWWGGYDVEESAVGAWRVTTASGRRVPEHRVRRGLVTGSDR